MNEEFCENETIYTCSLRKSETEMNVMYHDFKIINQDLPACLLYIYICKNLILNCYCSYRP